MLYTFVFVIKTEPEYKTVPDQLKPCIKRWFMGSPDGREPQKCPNVLKQHDMETSFSEIT